MCEENVHQIKLGHSEKKEKQATKGPAAGSLQVAHEGPVEARRVGPQQQRRADRQPRDAQEPKGGGVVHKIGWQLGLRRGNTRAGVGAAQAGQG